MLAAASSSVVSTPVPASSQYRVVTVPFTMTRSPFLSLAAAFRARTPVTGPPTSRPGPRVYPPASSAACSVVLIRVAPNSRTNRTHPSLFTLVIGPGTAPTGRPSVPA
jgi:hypothetical protein